LAVLAELAELPCAIDAEGIEFLGFGFGELMLDEAVDAAAAWTAAQAGPQLG
jgi:hypothetical protein